MATQRPDPTIGGALPVQTPAGETQDAGMEPEEEEELEKLESGVRERAEKILHYRSTLPEQLKDAFALLATVQRPDLARVEAASDDAGASHQGRGGNSDPGEASSLSERDRETAEKIELLKEKTSKSISWMPVLLKRMRECISTVDSLNTKPGTTHPAFKRNRSR